MNNKTLAVALSVAMALSVHAQQDTLGVSLDNVVVTGTRSATTTRNLPMTLSVVGREKLTENQRSNILPTLTEQVPGLFVTQRGMSGYGVSTGAAGGTTMRGISAGAGQLLILIDGHPQYQGVFGHSISDSYQTLMAERVEVLRGPASVLYGSNAMGGVINIVTRDMQKDGMKTNLNLGAGSWGTFEVEASNQVRVRRFSHTIGAQYSRSDNHRPDMGFEQYGGFVKFGYDLSRNWHAFADLDLTHFNASNPGSVMSPMIDNDQWITRGAAAVGIENHYAGTNGRLSVYDNFGTHKIDDGYAAGKSPQTELFRSSDALAGVSWYQTLNVLLGSITVGFDYQHIYGHAYYTDRKTGEVVTTGRRGMQSCDVNSDEVAGYVDIRQNLLSWLTVDAGIRYDYHSVAGSEWIPQGGIVVRPLATGELKLMASKGFRNPTTKDMFLYGTASQELKAERLWNYELSWHHTLCGGLFSYGANLFILKGDNMIQTVAGKNVNTGEISNRGAELEASWRISKHWTVNTNHSFLHMDHPVVAAPEYKGYLGAQWTCCRWAVSAGIQQICGLYTNVEKDKEQTEDFTLLNATVSYKVAHCLKLWVKGDNLLAQKYEINAGYPMPRATLMAGVNLMF